MNRTRIKLGVYVDLDPLPGTFHSADSARHGVASVLHGSGISAYNPTVSIESYDTLKDHGEPAEEERKAPEFLDQKQAINYLAYKEAQERLGAGADRYDLRREADMIARFIRTGS